MGQEEDVDGEDGCVFWGIFGGIKTERADEWVRGFDVEGCEAVCLAEV